jgi:hypothetical protein
LLTETLLDFEEPDVVMEQAFHRIADLLRSLSRYFFNCCSCNTS